MPTVVISPFNVANFPEGGGHFWVYMQYAQGLQQSGCEVYWMEQFRGSGDAASDELVPTAFLARMKRFGLGGKVLLYTSDAPNGTTGLPKEFIGVDRAGA